MKTEKLKEWGLNEEQIALVMRANGQDINKIREKFAGFGAMKEKLARLEASSQKEEEIHQQADWWRQKAEETENEWKQKWERRDFEEALRRSLRQAGARNEKAVRALLDEESIHLEKDGVLEGIQQQLAQLKTEHGYLFCPDQAPPIILRPGNREVEGSEESRIREIMGLPSFAAGKDDF